VSMKSSKRCRVPSSIGVSRYLRHEKRRRMISVIGLLKFGMFISIAIPESASYGWCLPLISWKMDLSTSIPSSTMISASVPMAITLGSSNRKFAASSENRGPRRETASALELTSSGPVSTT